MALKPKSAVTNDPRFGTTPLQPERLQPEAPVGAIDDMCLNRNSSISSKSNFVRTPQRIMKPWPASRQTGGVAAWKTGTTARVHVADCRSLEP